MDLFKIQISSSLLNSDKLIPFKFIWIPYENHINPRARLNRAKSTPRLFRGGPILNRVQHYCAVVVPYCMSSRLLGDHKQLSPLVLATGGDREIKEKSLALSEPVLRQQMS